jgi:hypothetical protein
MLEGLVLQFVSPKEIRFLICKCFRKICPQKKHLSLKRYIFNQSSLRRAGRPGDRGSIPGGGERVFPLASVSVARLPSEEKYSRRPHIVRFYRVLNKDPCSMKDLLAGRIQAFLVEFFLHRYQMFLLVTDGEFRWVNQE